MIKYPLLLLTYFLTFSWAMAQNYEKIVVNPTDSLNGYYLAVKPQSNQINGVLVLLDGFGGRAEDIFAESKIPNAAFDNDVLTIAVAMGNKLYADSNVVQQLNRLLADVIKRYSVPMDKFIIGGFSAGGTIALRYVELCKAQPTNYPIAPKAVFTVDSPVDLVDL